MSDWQLAQVNVGRMRGQRDDPQVAGFYAELDAINAIADDSPGFVWRLQGDGNDATDLRPTPDPLFLINMSVWADADALFGYVYCTMHAKVMAGRREWFERPAGAYQALWWVAAGRRPSVDEALAAGPFRAERTGVYVQAAVSSTGPGRPGHRHEARPLVQRLGLSRRPLRCVPHADGLSGLRRELRYVGNHQRP